MLQRYNWENRIGWYGPFQKTKVLERKKEKTYYEALKKGGDKNSQWRPIWWVSSHLMWLSLLQQKKDYIYIYIYIVVALFIYIYIYIFR